MILRTQLHGLFKMAVNALFPARSIPSVNHTSCEESTFFLSTNQKNWINLFSQKSLFGDHTADKELRWPWARNCSSSNVQRFVTTLSPKYGCAGSTVVVWKLYRAISRIDPKNFLTGFPYDICIIITIAMQLFKSSVL